MAKYGRKWPILLASLGTYFPRYVMPRTRSNLALTPADRQEIRIARKMLADAGSSLSIPECVRIALGTEDTEEIDKVTVEEAVDRFLLHTYKRVQSGHTSPSTYRFYESRLIAFAETFSDEHLATLTRDDIEERFLDHFGHSHWRAVRRLLNHAEKARPRPWLRINPAARIERDPPKRKTEIQYLSTEDAAAIMHSGVHTAAFALMLFAGLRPDEVCRTDHKPPLTWQQIDMEARIVRVTAEQSKTHRPRALEGLPDALWTWLATIPAEDRHGAVTDVRAVAVNRSAQRAAGFVRESRGKWVRSRPWPVDAMRHSFATYAVATGHDMSTVALWLGHGSSLKMLHDHYRGLATAAEAKRFWAIGPEPKF